MEKNNWTFQILIWRNRVRSRRWDVTLRLYELLSERVDKEKLNKIYEIFEKPMIKLVQNGDEWDKINDEYLKKLSKKFEIV